MPSGEADDLPARLGRLESELDEKRRLIVHLEGEMRRLREELERVHSSALGRVTGRMQAAARRVAPYGTGRQRLLHTAAENTAVLIEQGPAAMAARIRRRRHHRSLRGEFADTPDGRQRQYRAWLQSHDPSAVQLARMREEVTGWDERPLVSLVMPVKDPERAWLEEAVESVRSQTYAGWELCVVDDASRQPVIHEMLRRYETLDSRIRVRFREDSGGIVAASNDALSLARGDWVGFLDHDDLLRPHALYATLRHLLAHPEVDVCYSDEDKLLPDGERGDPLFKPDWSPEMLLSSNYITHFVLLRRRLVENAGGFRSGLDGSQDHDLLLRATEHARGVAHVPDVLYSWRMVRGSAALSSDYKPLAREAGRTAVMDALQRRGLSARVDFGRYPGFYNLRYATEGQPPVAIVIPTRDRLGLLRTAIDSVERLSTYPNYSIIIVNNQSGRAETIEYLRATRHRVVDVDSPFNFSALVNAAVAATDAEHVVLFNNDVTVITPGWIEAMLAHSQRADVGAVGARLLYPDGTVQHEGIVLGRMHLAANVSLGWPGVREVSAVTGACLMTRRSVFVDAGGFDEGLAEAFNDVDYCLRVRRAGRRVVYTPLAELSHREGATRGRRIPDADRAYFVERWGDEQTLEDPYLNMNVLWPNPLRLRFD